MSDLEKHQEQALSVGLGDGKPANKHVERSVMLAGLPDPDAGKTDEERAAIVSWLLPPNDFLPPFNLSPTTQIVLSHIQ